MQTCLAIFLQHGFPKQKLIRVLSGFLRRLNILNYYLDDNIDFLLTGIKLPGYTLRLDLND